MAVTNTLARSVTVAQLFVRSMPLAGAGGVATEPAFSIGDWVRQFILAPPFAWRWNRATTTIPITSAGGQDYTKVLNDFGWLEKASWNDGANTQELQIALDLSEDTQKNPPVQIAARLDNNTGTITFRVLPPPDKNYTVTITYQKAAPIFATLNDTWSPIPDYLSYLCNQGFAAKAYEYFSDERFLSAMQIFVKQVIAANAGLDESQKNIFLGERITTGRQSLAEQTKTQMGATGRGLQ